jgi:hypothetical protein
MNCHPCDRNRPTENWRRRPDLNRGWRFCRPLPYHLATAPVGIGLCGGFRPRLQAATTACHAEGFRSHHQHGHERRADRSRRRSADEAECAAAATGATFQYWSGKRDSNPRLRPWQGRTLPLSYSRPHPTRAPAPHCRLSRCLEASIVPQRRAARQGNGLPRGSSRQQNSSEGGPCRGMDQLKLSRRSFPNHHPPRSDRDPDDSARNQDGVYDMAARTRPRVFLHRPVRRPAVYQDIRLSLTMDAPGADRLHVPDVHRRDLPKSLHNSRTCRRADGRPAPQETANAEG